jgi:cobalt-zinc-cadmium resistance protein CzcA
MFDAILKFSITHRFLVLTSWLLVALGGAAAYQHLIVDAVPDITTIQVQINTPLAGASPLEIEQRVTQPIELILSGIPNLEHTRSLSRYGLSQVTAIFTDRTNIYFARQQINERLREASERLPAGVSPSMGPIATGLGEIVMYSLENAPKAKNPRSLEDLRELQDWVVKPQLRTLPGVVEINSIGGAVKQIVISPNLDKLQAYGGITLSDIKEAVAHNNANVGAGFIEDRGEQFLIRIPAQAESLDDLRNIIIGVHEHAPIRLRDIASVEIGSELRTGAATKDGHEAVLGTVFMLMGENGREVSARVTKQIEAIASSLPKEVIITPLYNRLDLVSATISTVKKNLFEGALLVIAILFFALGNMRAALITACVIPLSMLLSLIGMVHWRMSANLMSLGALDFGLLVDGAVIIVENCLKRMEDFFHREQRPPTASERRAMVLDASSEVRQASTFGEVIIMAAYLPILTLSGIEGKMYQPMAYTVLLALASAFIASLTFVPAAIATFLSGPIRPPSPIMRAFAQSYRSTLQACMKFPLVIIGASTTIFGLSLHLGRMQGSEFIPSLDEGDIALHALRIPGTSLTQAVEMQHDLEEVIKKLPEVKYTFAKIGTAEIATDPMPPSVADGFVILKPRDEWPNPRKPKTHVVADLERVVSPIPGNNYEFTQPIQMRFNELIAGVRSDVAVKVFGDSTEQLFETGEQIQSILATIPGASDVKVEQVTGLPIITVTPRRETLASFGLNPTDIQEIATIGHTGETISTFFSGDRRIPIVLRFAPSLRTDRRAIANLPIPLPASEDREATTSLLSRHSTIKPEVTDRPSISLGEVSDIAIIESPNQISREDGKRRCVVTANVRNRDLGSFVAEAQSRIAASVPLPEGYWIAWGGQFEHLLSAQSRLVVIVPLVLSAIFILIMVTLRSLTLSLLVFTGIPFALSGGMLALWLRGIPLSISAAVGFIALCGVSVLNGLVLVSFAKGRTADADDPATSIIEASVSRLRPVLMTALVASLGFIPMAVSQGTGSEVQRPLATVVIGGIISSTALTLVVLPVLLAFIEDRKRGRAEAIHSLRNTC